MKDLLVCLTYCEIKTVAGGTGCFGLIENGHAIIWKERYDATNITECYNEACAIKERNTSYLWNNRMHKCNSQPAEKIKKIIELINTPTSLGSEFGNTLFIW